jgi:hypothetical protein
MLRTTFRLLLTASALSLTLIAAAPAAAIVGGAEDHGAHPQVGALVARFPDGDFPACSGTLISPTVFLTAGHCIAITSSFGAVGYAVTFAPQVTFDVSGRVVGALPGTATLNPLFGHDQGDFEDLAVITLDQPVGSAHPARLATADTLGRLAAKRGLAGRGFTVVGYGATGFSFGAGRPEPNFDFVRRSAVSSFMSLDATRLFLHIGSGGGICYADSGGPALIDDGAGEVLVSVASLKGDTMCQSLNVNYRVDTAPARAFLGRFVRLP